MLLDITPLRVSRDYRLLFFGQLISYFGSMMTFIVVPVQMFKLTGSNAMVGYIYLAEFVPMVILAIIGGALADAFDRRQILRVTEIGQTLATALLLANSCLAQPQVWVLFVAVALHAGFAAVQRPAFESFIQKVVPPEHMPAVMALNAVRYCLGAIISPALGGIVAAQYSSTVAYGFDVTTFLASLIAVFLLRADPSREHADRPSLQATFQGWSYALSRQELLGTYLVDMAAMFFAMPQALYPALGKIYGEQYVGAFPAAIATGALVASLTSGWTKHVHRHGLMITIAAVLWGLAIVGFGYMTNIWLALGFLALAGFWDAISGIFRGSIWNQTIPNFLRGRLASIEVISYLAGPMLGNAKMGVVAEEFGVPTAIISGGLICVFAILILALLLPKFLRYDGREGVKQKEIEEANQSGAAAEMNL
ncbi:MFS transporter [Anatilimnocola floriformis]|uniref:MFS transporter n=1 Tax=Anatilimnocola floriformis TaxID=2948575 RepID=UPI0020C48A93|nr:MFS transporter [Anatilimnocola floriformis]